MRNVLLGVFLLVGIAFTPVGFAQQNMRTEMGEHPRIAAAIRELEGAIAYMEKAPHDFGGHKAKAIADSRAAVHELREALKYRADQDDKRKRK